MRCVIPVNLGLMLLRIERETPLLDLLLWGPADTAGLGVFFLFASWAPGAVTRACQLAHSRGSREMAPPFVPGTRVCASGLSAGACPLDFG
jgi:hypothetical protein